jgi:glutaryl-CoA dehydrogenase
MTQATSAHLGESLGTDFFSVREQFTDEQWEHFIAVRRFVDEEVVPVVGPYWERAEICWPLVKRLPELGIVGEDIKGYGCAGMSPMACGLVTMELHRGDGSLGVFLGVHAGLAMKLNRDVRLGGAEGALAARHGCHGQAGGRSRSPNRSTARTRSPWKPQRARTGMMGAERPQAVDRPGQRGRPRGRVGPQHRGRPGQRVRRGEGIAGLPGPGHRGKVSLRSVWQAEITLENVRVPAENRLPGARSFKDTTRILATTRSTCAWGALGHATAATTSPCGTRRSGASSASPLASFQIIQQRLVSMLADLTAMQLYCLQIGRLAEAGRLTPTVAGLAKMHNTRKARAITAEARDMLGGNGILLDYQVMRHMVDMEAIHTFEGTETMQTLIVGRAITGLGAFT